ncbi:MAG: exodeoxyribonuclease III [Bacteroidota bacterium]
MKIITYNLNGIRSAMTKGLTDFIVRENADVLCFQELKANQEDIDEEALRALGYHCFWYSAQKKGYSGVGLISKKAPDRIHYGCGHELFDNEGRVIRADFGDTSVLSCYFPSGTTGDIRQDVKYQFLAHFRKFMDDLKATNPKQKFVICGDYNICHKPIDIHDPVSNKNSSGFLPEERAWMDEWFDSGMVDTFRILNPEPHNYTWWSFRANARNNNKGWRIDYISVTDNLKNNIKASGIYNTDIQSDHCGSYLLLE